MANDFFHRDPKSKKHLRIRVELFSVLVIVGMAAVFILVNANAGLSSTLGSVSSKVAAETGTVGLLNQSVQNLTTTLNTQNAKISSFVTKASQSNQEISTLENEVAAYKKNDSSLLSSYAFLKSSFNSLQLSVNQMLSKIATKNGVIGNLTNTITNLEAPTNTSASSFFLLNNNESSFVWLGTTPFPGENSTYNTTWAMCPVVFGTQCTHNPYLANYPAGMTFQFMNKNTMTTNFLVYSLEKGPDNKTGMTAPGYMTFVHTANQGNIQVWKGSTITGMTFGNYTNFGYDNFTGTLYFNGTPSGSSLINGTLIQYGYSYPKWNKAFPGYFLNTVNMSNGNYLDVVSLNYLYTTALNNSQLDALVSATKFPVITEFNGTKI